MGFAPRRAKTRWLGLFGIVVLLFGMLPVAAVLAGPVGTASGFEDDDGNLTIQSTFDWNSFAPTTWNGTAPYRIAEKTVSGWKFKGLEDAQATTSDSGFAGGTKQDDACASVITAKAPNKDDLKRIYVSSKAVTVNNTSHTILNLAWVRIPQNTTSASAHVAFEFNKGTDGLCAGSTLYKRVAGDMLIVYDFEGGSSAPVLTLRRWVTSGACEISSNSAPCWGTATNLTALGYAEAAVNVGSTASDGIAPPPGVPASLGDSEFGEAGIDLTDAGVFSANTCETFGSVFGVSRSSGNSGQAQMKDLVGPGSFALANCGSIIIRKVTVPTGGTGFGFVSTATTNPATSGTFSLNDGGSKTISNVLPGTGLTVTEDDPSGLNYTLTDLTCTAGSTATNIVKSIANRRVTFDLAGDQTLDCTFTNTKNKNNPDAVTAPTLIPQDSATVSGLDTTGVVDGAFDKELTFSLWDNAACSTASGGQLLYSKTVTVTANTTYKTDNTGLAASNGYTITADGTYYWKVVYDGDSRNNPFTKACGVEQVTVNITPDPAP